MDLGPNRLKFSWYGPNLVKASAPQKSRESMVPIYLKKKLKNKYIGSKVCDFRKFRYIGLIFFNEREPIYLKLKKVSI